MPGFSLDALTDDELDDLVWIMTHPAAVATMSKRTLRILVETYGRAQEAAVKARGEQP